MDIKQLHYSIAIVEAGSPVDGCDQDWHHTVVFIAIYQDIGRPSRRRTAGELGERGTMIDAGIVMLTHAKQIVRAVEKVNEEVKAFGREAHGKVALGLPSSVSMVLSVRLAQIAAEALVLPSSNHGLRSLIERFAKASGALDTMDSSWHAQEPAAYRRSRSSGANHMKWTFHWKPELAEPTQRYS